MFLNFKKSLSNLFYEKFYSFFENVKNKKLISAYKKIIKINSCSNLPYKRLLIDGHFYNLGYIYRLQLIRSALISSDLQEHVYIWGSNKRILKYILKSIGIKHISDLSKNYDQELILEAEKIAKNIKEPLEIINYSFPEGVPGIYLYDVILKKQRLKTVNINDKNLKKYIYEYLLAIKSSKKLIKEFKPDILVISHSVSFQCAPMAYLATKKEIKTIILTGGFGLPRFIKIKNKDDLFFGIPHPPKRDLELIDSSKVDSFIQIGENYLNRRISGHVKDLSGRLAFGKGKTNLDLMNAKISNKPIVAIYVNNWFDFPHTFGMTRFLDVHDWVNNTIDMASKNDEVIWLLKPHPAEEWYGGVTLEESIKRELPPNILLLPNSYSGKAIMDVADALVILHGTSAIEYASCGKPVLVADKGWLEDCNFVVFSNSLDHYLELLRSKWFEGIDIEKIKAKAKLFAGVYFGVPDWQENATLPDDSDRDLLRDTLPIFLNENKKVIEKEILCIKKWIIDDSIDYHTFKMINYSDEKYLEEY